LLHFAELNYAGLLKWVLKTYFFKVFNKKKLKNLKTSEYSFFKGY